MSATSRMPIARNAPNDSRTWVCAPGSAALRRGRHAAGPGASVIRRHHGHPGRPGTTAAAGVHCAAAQAGRQLRRLPQPGAVRAARPVPAAPLPPAPGPGHSGPHRRGHRRAWPADSPVDQQVPLGRSDVAPASPLAEDRAGVLQGRLDCKHGDHNPHLHLRHTARGEEPHQRLWSPPQARRHGALAAAQPPARIAHGRSAPPAIAWKPRQAKTDRKLEQDRSHCVI